MNRVLGIIALILSIIFLVVGIVNYTVRYILENLEVYVAEDCVYVIISQGNIHEYDYVEWEGDM